MKVLLCGGGTAGHITPLLAVSAALKKNLKVKFLYVGSTFGLEKKLAQKYQVPFSGILAGKWRPYFSWLNFLDLVKTFIGIIQTFFILLFFRPKVVLAKGGYVTFPVLFWLKFFKIPLVIHESDAVMGRANRWAVSRAAKICLGFPLSYYCDLPLDKIVYTGTPVLPEFFTFASSVNQPPTILITGGSQGSQKINQLIGEILPSLLEKYRVIHLAGPKNYETLKAQNIGHHHYKLIGFSEEMAKLLASADLVISRAGANTLAEIAALSKSSILIPLPGAASDHQADNAAVFQKASAAVVLKEENLTSGSLLSIINRLMEDEATRRLLGHHAHEFAQKDSAQQIVDILFEVTQ